MEICLESTFSTKEELKNAVINHAFRKKFKIKVIRSSKTRYCVRCVEESCGFFINTNLSSAANVWVISSLDLVHSRNCARRHFRHVDSLIIENSIRDIIIENELKSPLEVLEHGLRDINCYVGYKKLWNTIQRTKKKFFNFEKDLKYSQTLDNWHKFPFFHRT